MDVKVLQRWAQVDSNGAITFGRNTFVRSIGEAYIKLQPQASSTGVSIARPQLTAALQASA
jgi:hypothetical protein